jgi:hypothetical protein
MEQLVNQRRWQRYPFDASVRVVVDDFPVHPPNEATVVDGRGVRFSEGGICLFAAANLPLGTRVKVEFRTPTGDEPVQIRGKVRNRTVYLYGVEFLSSRSEDRQQLARLSDQIRSGSTPSA